MSVVHVGLLHAVVDVKLQEDLRRHTSCSAHNLLLLQGLGSCACVGGKGKVADKSHNPF